MTKFDIYDSHIADEHQRRNNTDLLSGLNQLAQFIYYGTGVPAFTPVDELGNTARAVFIRTDGGAGSTLYVYEGAAWAGK